jgi:cytidine deaminase
MTIDDPAIEELHRAALAAREQAHCPYSHYAVGAAIRTDAGEVYTGCNVENASYPEGTCAETGAIAAMALAGGGRIADIVTVTAGDPPGTPCGGCRQRIREFASATTRIHATTVDGTILTMSMDELLPASFGPEHLTSESE